MPAFVSTFSPDLAVGQQQDAALLPKSSLNYVKVIFIACQSIVLPLIDFDMLGAGLRLCDEVSSRIVFFYPINDFEDWLVDSNERGLVSFIQIELVGHMREYGIMQVGRITIDVLKS